MLEITNYVIKKYIYKAKDVLKEKGFDILYNSLVPYIKYCVEVWGNACKTHTNQIFIY